MAFRFEFGTTIWMNPDGTYEYDYPMEGTSNKIDIIYLYEKYDHTCYSLHSHVLPGEKGIEDFSLTDKDISKKRGMPSILFTPSGAMKLFNPITGRTTVISQ